MTNLPTNKKTVWGIGTMAAGLFFLWVGLAFFGMVVLGTGIYLLWTSKPKKTS